MHDPQRTRVDSLKELIDAPERNAFGCVEVREYGMWRLTVLGQLSVEVDPSGAFRCWFVPIRRSATYEGPRHWTGPRPEAVGLIEAALRFLNEDGVAEEAEGPVAAGGRRR